MESAAASVRRGPQPVFDRAALTAAVAEATQIFHTRWRATLGLQADPEIPKEHWARIKALTRRLAQGEEEYRLKTAGELRYELQARIYKMLQQPNGCTTANSTRTSATNCCLLQRTCSPRTTST